MRGSFVCAFVSCVITFFSLKGRGQGCWCVTFASKIWVWREQSTGREVPRRVFAARPRTRGVTRPDSSRPLSDAVQKGHCGGWCHLEIARGFPLQPQKRKKKKKEKERKNPDLDLREPVQPASGSSVSKSHCHIMYAHAPPHKTRTRCEDSLITLQSPLISAEITSTTTAGYRVAFCLFAYFPSANWSLFGRKDHNLAAG